MRKRIQQFVCTLLIAIRQGYRNHSIYFDGRYSMIWRVKGLWNFPRSNIAKLRSNIMRYYMLYLVRTFPDPLKNLSTHPNIAFWLVKIRVLSGKINSKTILSLDWGGIKNRYIQLRRLVNIVSNSDKTIIDSNNIIGQI